MCEQRGHRVIYLSPYHPELQPIEMLLAYVKRKVSKLFKGKRSMDQVREETRRAFEDVPISVCAGHFSHCKKVREDLRHIPRATVDDEESEDGDIGAVSDESDGSDDEIESLYIMLVTFFQSLLKYRYPILIFSPYFL